MRYHRWPTAPWFVLGLIVLLGLVRVLRREPASHSLPAADVRHYVRRVIDGDTLVLDSGHRVRLLGVDCPEARHADQPQEHLAEEATRFLQEFVQSRPIRLEYDRERRDRYGRVPRLRFCRRRAPQ